MATSDKPHLSRFAGHWQAALDDVAGFGITPRQAVVNMWIIYAYRYCGTGGGVLFK